jgi:hypothetical protein
MNKETEKQMIYQELVELTKNSEPNDYFSKYTILDAIKEGMECGYVPNGNLPGKNRLGPNLEELVGEGKVKKMVGNATRGCVDGKVYTFYRAISP